MKLNVTELDLTKLRVSSEQDAPRSPGIHVSTILRYIKTRIGTTKESDFDETDLEWFSVVGRLWERILAEILYPVPRYCRIGEVERDGIMGSPDILDLELSQFGEFKVTWQSSREFKERIKFREYLWQLKSYICIGQTFLPAQVVYPAWIDVFHICGDYRPPRPCALHYDLEFSHGELREHWIMMKTNAEYVREAVHDSRP